MMLARHPVHVLLGAVALGLGMTVVTATGATAINANPAAPQADGCYTWSGELSTGDSGDAVTNLQTRIAGWSAEGSPVVVDGQFGAATEAALKRFQEGYGLSASGVADSATFTKIYELQDDDCSPVHFTFDEFTSGDGSGFSGGNASEAEVRANVLLNMWKLEALRHKMGDVPLQISSAFRSVAYNEQVGGVSNSNHTYGNAVDLVGSPSLCALAQNSRTAGFNEIIGPGAEGHSDHTHVATRSDQSWNAPQCM